MLKNMTPHPVNIYSPDDVTYVPDQRKWFLRDGAKPIVVIPPSGTLLNATQTVVDDGDIDGIPLKKADWSVSGFVPDPDTYYIVSALFKSAYQGLFADRLLTVGDPVYQSIDNPRPVGCLFLAH